MGFGISPALDSGSKENPPPPKKKKIWDVVISPVLDLGSKTKDTPKCITTRPKNKCGTLTF